MTLLKLNRETGMLEMTVTIRVDRGAHLRRLLAYIEKNNIDYTDLVEYKKALDTVSSLYEWQHDPNASVISQEPKQIAQVKEEPVKQVPQNKTPVKSGIQKGESNYKETSWTTTRSDGRIRSLNKKQQEEFIALAMDTPVEKWNDLITQIPEDLPIEKRQPYYAIRNDQKTLLARLYQQTEPDKDKLLVLAEATNGLRHK